MLWLVLKFSRQLLASMLSCEHAVNRFGYKGFYNRKQKPVVLNSKAVEGIQLQGGTILGTSRGGADIKSDLLLTLLPSRLATTFAHRLTFEYRQLCIMSASSYAQVLTLWAVASGGTYCAAWDLTDHVVHVCCAACIVSYVECYCSMPAAWLVCREIVKRIDMWGIDMLFVVGGNGGNEGATEIQAQCERDQDSLMGGCTSSGNLSVSRRPTSTICFLA